MTNRAARSAAYALMLGSILIAGGCQSNKTTAEPGAPIEDKMADRALGEATVTKAGDSRTINSVCPIGGHDFNPVNHTLVRTVNGVKIGFCCEGCSDHFDTMNDAEKAEILALAKDNKAKP